MRIRRALGAVLAAGALAGGVVGVSAQAAGADSRLRAFSGCEPLLAHLKQRAVPLVGPYGLGQAQGLQGGALPPGAVAARDGVASQAQQAGVDYSTTNVQESGVDEPDMVKTEGDHLFVVSGGRLNVVDVRGRSPRLVGTLRLEGGWSHELLLHGHRLLVISQGFEVQPAGGARMSSIWMPYPSRTVLAEVDVSNPAKPRIARTLEVDGGYLAARLVGGAARIVVSSSIPQKLRFEPPVGPAADASARATARNRELVRGSGIAAWLPAFTRRNARQTVVERGSLVQCRNVRRPTGFSGLGLLTVLTVDLTRGLDPVDSDALLTDARIAYASKTGLYLATERWDQRFVQGQPLVSDVTTTIHKFDITSPTRTTYRASGTVPGYLLSQWSLSEHRGVLRVASTERPTWWSGPEAESESSVTTLDERAGALVQLGRVGGLGRGERVYSVRFAGEVGYVVTFRQVDPLYTLDLSSPSSPAVRGELKIAGYSAYLHPVGDNLLLGLGQDATPEGRVLGAQLSLFDVSDLRRPRRLHAQALGKAWSDAEADHRAFLWWPRTQLAVIPVNSYESPPFAGALGFRIGRARGIDPIGRVEHPLGKGSADSPVIGAQPVRRSLVARGALYTVSDRGVQASSLDSLAPLGWVSFPEAPASRP